MEIAIRAARLEDLKAITDIYNEAIINTVATFDTQPKTMEDQIAWFEMHEERHPILVAKVDGKVVGWTSLSPWSDRCAYADTAEISTYIQVSFRGKGLGKRLKVALIEEAKTRGIHSIISRVAGNNQVSKILNKQLGFRFIGTMREVGKKFGSLHDVHLYQLIF
jgi:L-amino acid N-acyltransferase YncA